MTADGRPRTGSSSATALYGAAASLALLSLGLPWGTVAASRFDFPFLTFGTYWLGPDSEVFGPVGDVAIVSVDIGGGTVAGAQTPMRVFAVVATLLLASAVQQGAPGRARLALLVGAAALPFGVVGGAVSGPFVYALALVLAARAAGVLPSRAAASRSGTAERR